ncbi:hypothetical protein R3P38DRAFT_3320552 [Favolaschia claudopus]|uniref:Uncharacterized protein n=1 Tax=Favolaschia claudopus TaxID=2862362 RepID=A0AAW0AUT3_9AGAR
MRFTFTVIAAVVLALNAKAQDFIAWSGNACNGAEGLEVACDGTCFDFSGRHSFEVLNAFGTVTLYSGRSCTGKTFYFGTETPGECINVNTGTNIQTFRCT